MLDSIIRCSLGGVQDGIVIGAPYMLRFVLIREHVVSFG